MEEVINAPSTGQESDSSTVLENPGNIESVFCPSEPNSFDDLNLPIALRKGTRSCTQHPRYSIANYVSYHKLLPPFKAFVSNICSVEIPKSVQEALIVPEWKEAVLEEMIAPEKNGT